MEKQLELEGADSAEERDFAAFLEAEGVEGGPDDVNDDGDGIEIAADGKATERSTDDDDGDGKDDEPELDERAKGRERLAQKLSTRERELSSANRRIRELEQQLNARAAADPDLLDDRVRYVRGQIARGLGLDAEDPRVAEELKELVDDLVLADVSADMLADPKNEHLRRQIDERRSSAAARRDRLALERRMAELERREQEQLAHENAARAKGQLDGYLRARADDLPFLIGNPDGDPVQLVYDGLMHLRSEGHDLSTDAAATAAVERVAASLESHYSSVAERLAAIRERRSAIGIANDGAKRQSGAEPKRRSGGRTVSGKSNGGRGSAPPPSDEEETFEEFMRRGLDESRVARRGR